MKLSENRSISKVQGINEVMVFGLASIATLSSVGYLKSLAG